MCSPAGVVHLCDCLLTAPVQGMYEYGVEMGIIQDGEIPEMRLQGKAWGACRAGSANAPCRGSAEGCTHTGWSRGKPLMRFLCAAQALWGLHARLQLARSSSPSPTASPHPRALTRRPFGMVRMIKLPCIAALAICDITAWQPWWGEHGLVGMRKRLADQPVSGSKPRLAPSCSIPVFHGAMHPQARADRPGQASSLWK